MPRGRISRTASALRDAANRVANQVTRGAGFGVMGHAASAVEPLESRQLLTTLVGGESFTYVDARNRIMQITMVGTIEAEFTALRVRATDNSQVIRDLVPAPPPNVTTDGADLYNIYINSAGPDGQIIITELTGTPLRPNPFTAPPPGFKINDNTPTAGDPPPLQTPGGTGGVFIGARTRDATLIPGDDEANILIVTNPFRQPLGVRPATRGIRPGIESAPGVSLDKILIGGTITGRVFIGGSVNTIYAGNVFTGDSSGIVGNANTTLPNNFFIGGNLRNFLVSGSVGTDVIETDSETDFRTGFDMRVGGRLGNVNILNDYSGSIEAVNNPEIEIQTEANEEVEAKPPQGATAGSLFQQGLVSIDGFYNDSFASNGSQFGSSQGSAITGDLQGLDFSGSLNSLAGDTVDYYNLPLIAGQRPTILLQGGFQVGVFDPLGRLVNSDLTDAGGAGLNEQFQFTAELPGTYKLAVGSLLDPDFTGGSRVFGTYTLSVQNYGNVALGGVQVGGPAKFNEPDQGIFVRSGDLGAVNTTGSLFSNFQAPISVARGNLRAVDSEADIGTAPDAQLLLPPTLNVPRGSVGYVRADGLINLNNDAIDASITGTGAEPIVDRIVGEDYQRIEAGGELHGYYTARGAIGHVIAGSIPNTFGGTIFFANADRIGQDGAIDLIDVAGDFGSTPAGGPGLYTGPGGNVKYVRVGGETFRDRAFGNTVSTTQNGQPGQSLTFTDDSGAVATFAPGSVIGAPPTTGGAPTVNPGSLTATLYGVRDNGGSVLIELTSTAGISVAARSQSGQFDVSEMTTTGVGTATTANIVGASLVNPNGLLRVGYLSGSGTAQGVSIVPATPNEVTIRGRSPVNVFSLTGTNITSVINDTAGEMAGINANTLGIVRAQNIGTIRSSTAADVAVPTNQLVGGATPFNPFAFGVFVNGSVIEVSAREAIGTFNAANGAVALVRANSDGRSARGSFDGIVGPVAAQRLGLVNVGRGIAKGGNGGIAEAGVFALNGVGTFGTSVDQVIAQNADIRGIIASEGTIGNINVRNGSLIGASVLTVSTIDQVLFNNRTFVFPDQSTGLNTFSLRGVSVVGNGGIIGSRIGAGNFAAIDVRGGFGILNSRISGAATGRSNGTITTDGLGIRNTVINAGGSISRIEARGNGERLNLRNFSPSVRAGERGRFDAFTGRTLTGSNDLYRNLGLTRGTPVLSGVTNAGIIEDVVAAGNGELSELRAYVIRSGVDNTLASNTQDFPMRLQFANRTGRIFATQGINGLRVVTGELDELNTGGNFENATINVAGRIELVAVGGIFRGSATVTASGPEGSIGLIQVKRGLLGQVSSQQNIDVINAGSTGSTIESSQGIGNLKVRGSVLTGSFISARRAIGILSIDGDVQNGATIRASSFGTQAVGGRILGRIIDT